MDYATNIYIRHESSVYNILHGMRGTQFSVELPTALLNCDYYPDCKTWEMYVRLRDRRVSKRETPARCGIARIIGILKSVFDRAEGTPNLFPLSHIRKRTPEGSCSTNSILNYCRRKRFSLFFHQFNRDF